jgi:copper(I)-binding protein
MRPVNGGLEIKPGQTVELKPGSFHIMFGGLKKPLANGDHIKATLMFEALNVEFDVHEMGASTTGAKDSMPGMQMPSH